MRICLKPLPATSRPLISGSYDGFNEGALESFWREKIDGALASGFEGVRGCGDSDIPQDDQQQLEYEEWLHAFLADKLALALCTYPLTAAGALDVFSVVRTHNITVARHSTFG